MTRIYCECGTELTILKTVSDDLYSLKHIVESCPNCIDDWQSIENDPPKNEDYYLVCQEGYNTVQMQYYSYGVFGCPNPIIDNPTHYKPMPKAKGAE